MIKPLTGPILLTKKGRRRLSLNLIRTGPGARGGVLGPCKMGAGVAPQATEKQKIPSSLNNRSNPSNK